MEGYLAGTYARARAQRMFEGAIQSAWLPAAEAGFREGGGDPDDFTDDELAEIRDAEAEQVGYARDWWAELGALREVVGYDPNPRLALYVSSLSSWYENWRLYGDKNKMLQWVLGDTETHCEDEGGTYGCANLAGTWHRWKWYDERGLKPRTPGSNTTCGGWRCDCKLVDKSGDEYFVD